MDNKILEIFIPGPAGRLEAKYFKSKKSTSPIALILQPHPQYGGTMNNKVVVETFHSFMDNNFSENSTSSGQFKVVIFPLFIVSKTFLSTLWLE